jgi:thiamine pyrophosphate-dependent acetolactate synthase large subunit-like protein/nitrite reductase/ring-hydroxylating ferredoxin subunit
MAQTDIRMVPEPSLEAPQLPADGVTWHRALALDELPEGRVKTVTVGRRSLAMTHYLGGYGALDNRCPHQGGPLGEGSIEKGWLRCPWHGYDYSPCNGTPPPGFKDAPASYRTEVRADGVYVALPPEAPHARTVSDVMVETMVNWGVTHVFGMVGHSNLGLADAFRAAEERGDLRFVGIRHEGAASFAASAYGKLTGRLAACFGIAGPGSTNLLTGLYDAKVDRAPVLALSGQVPSKVLGRGAFQDVDLNAAFAAVARSTHCVLAESDHAELVNLACKTALLERDVAHLVFPDEVQNVPANGAMAGGPAGRVADRAIAPPADALDAALERIGSARRPLFIVGNGARHHMDAVVALAEQIGAPVATTFKAKGQISDHHPLGCGVLGRSGTPIASWFMNECDLVVAFGASFSNHTGIASYKPIVQVDFDPMALGRFHAVAVPVLGDVGVTARLLAEALPPDPPCLDHRPEVAERWAIWRDEKARRRRDDSGHGVNSASVFDAMSELVPDDAVLCVDVGNNAYSFGRYFEVSGRQDVLMSGYLGSIGFAFPAAMGAWAAVGDCHGVPATQAARPVVSVSGDGGFGQYAMELTTAVKYGMNITHVLLNNGELGKISKEQRAGEWQVWQTSLHNPDFAAFASLCGAAGSRVASVDQLAGALRAALAHPGPALVEVVADPLLV